MKKQVCDRKLCSILTRSSSVSLHVYFFILSDYFYTLLYLEIPIRQPASLSSGSYKSNENAIPEISSKMS